MALLISSSTAQKRHGAFVLERKPPTVLRTDVTGIASLVGQFDWGPDKALITRESPASFLKLFAPAGSSRLSTGYLSYIAKTWPDGLRIVRVLGTGVAATATLASSTPANIFTVAAKYKGPLGNSIIATVSDASDGDANHFNLQLSLSGDSGSTTDTLENVNFSGTGTDTVLTAGQLDSLLLCGALTKLASGRPVNGTFATFTGGANGTINSASYVGTPGGGDQGFALLEADPAIQHVCMDDCGSSIRAAVNAGMVAHIIKMGDRIGYINGDNGLSVSAAQADKLNYLHQNIMYMDPWVRVRDDVTGAKRDVPLGPFGGSVASQLSPSTSIAWKGAPVGAMLQGIVEPVAVRDGSAGDNTDLGICTLVREADGSYRFEADANTINASNPAKGSLRRSRMLIYIGRAFVESTRESIDAPNVPVIQQDPVNAIARLLSGLKKAKDKDPINTPHIVDYDINLDGANSEDDIQAGNFSIPVDVEVSAALAKLLLSLNIGETVRIVERQ